MEMKYKDNNRGAAFVVVLAVFTFMIVIIMSILMLASSVDYNVGEEYDTKQAELYVSSIYQLIDHKVCTCEFKDAFVDGETTHVVISDLKDKAGNEIAVSLDVKQDRKRAEVTYTIGYMGEQYLLITDYGVVVNGSDKTITNRGCRGLQ